MGKLNKQFPDTLRSQG